MEEGRQERRQAGRKEGRKDRGMERWLDRRIEPGLGLCFSCSPVASGIQPLDHLPQRGPSGESLSSGSSDLEDEHTLSCCASREHGSNSRLPTKTLPWMLTNSSNSPSLPALGGVAHVMETSISAL